MLRNGPGKCANTGQGLRTTTEGPSVMSRTRTLSRTRRHQRESAAAIAFVPTVYLAGYELLRFCDAMNWMAS